MAKTQAEVMASHSAAGPPPDLRAGAGAGRDKTETVVPVRKARSVAVREMRDRETP